ncbi:MAG: hypothetical protein HY710_16170 [Candidatus Latescibacteria bacterium]|nr:hypothetical protein [Candidatus Latescibacterota bacterium]
MVYHLFCLCLIFLFFTRPAAAQPHQHAASSVAVPLFDNLGTYHHTVTTASPTAQRYFDQGLRLVYAFNHEEAIRAFKEAAHLDSTCAMAYWGMALALGPNINLDDPTQDRVAYDAVQKALALSSRVSKPERAYIEALSKRYSIAPDADRNALQQAYADAMREVARQYPDDLDATTLFAEAMMNLRPWALWTNDGQPQPGTLDIVSTLESVLQRNPNHPGANHYYIHAIEGSPRPDRGLAAADRLTTLVPGAGHLVHMPSHIYMRVGRYTDAAEANARAITVDRDYISKQAPQGVYPMMYYPHNIHFRWAALSMEGRSAEALQMAREVVAQLPVEMARQMPALEFVPPTVLFALVRFGKWEEVLKQPPPPADLRFTTAIWRYARGLAFTATGRVNEAAVEADSVKAIAVAMPADQVVGNNSGATLLSIASNALAGELAAKRGQVDKAVTALKEAIHLQDGLRYNEPPDWYYPVRQSLGAVLLAAGRATEAEAVYREDLKQNPDNGWSLYGLLQCLRARKAVQEAAAVEQRFKKAWARADVTLTASRF